MKRDLRRLEGRGRAEHERENNRAELGRNANQRWHLWFLGILCVCLVVLIWVAVALWCEVDDLRERIDDRGRRFYWEQE